jgi:O-antigen/teichoic acid export membrane protein
MMPNVPTQMEASSTLPIKPDRNILTAAKGGGIIFAGNLFQHGSRFIIAFLMARLLGSDQLGLTNITLSAAFITASLASLGLPAAMMRYIPVFSSRRDEAGLWGTLQIGIGLTALLSVFTSLGLFLLAEPIAERLFHDSRLVPLLQIISLVISFLALSEVFAAASRGFKAMQYAVLGQNIAQPAIRLVLIVILAITVGLNAEKALVAFSLAVITAFFILLYFLGRLFSLKRPLRAARRDTGEILRFSLPVYLSGLVSTFGSNIQAILLGALSTVANVGVFAVASQINLVGQMFHSSIVTASAPIVSELYERGEQEQMGRLYQAVTKWTFTLNLPLFLIVLLFPEPILSIFGKSFVGGATALTILAWANLVRTGTGICGAVLDMTGNTTLKMVNSLVTFGLTLGLNILLIPHWGLVGAAIAALIAATVVNLLRLTEVFVLFRLLPYNLSFVKPIVAGLSTLAVAVGLRLLFAHSLNLIGFVISVVVILAVYAGAILILGLSQEDRMVLARVGERVKSALSK